MKNTIKGALAVGTAGVILLGGAGSLAYWSASSTANVGAITTGSLSLTAATCDTAWTYATGSAAGQTATLIVPGDSITKSCKFTVAASGDHLSAKLSAPATVAYTKTPATGVTTDNLAVVTSYTLGAAVVANNAELTSADNSKVLTAKFVVTMPYGSGTVNANDTENLTATLAGLNVALTQDQTTGNNPS